jgi:hypothetical protein
MHRQHRVIKHDSTCNDQLPASSTPWLRTSREEVEVCAWTQGRQFSTVPGIRLATVLACQSQHTCACLNM